MSTAIREYRFLVQFYCLTDQIWYLDSKHRFGQVLFNQCALLNSIDKFRWYNCFHFLQDLNREITQTSFSSHHYQFTMIHLLEVQKKFKKNFKKNKEFIDQIKNGRINFYPDFYCLGFTHQSVLGRQQDQQNYQLLTYPLTNRLNELIFQFSII